MFRIFIGLLFFGSIHAQSLSKNVLFLGNSYTGVNNLPQMTAAVASSVGDSLFFDSNTPGGHTLQGHSSNSISLSKIALGNWDFVVLQEQSQLPSFPDNQVQTAVFPYARTLDSIINVNNSCAETVFYMTWGRKNGDASNCSNFPPVCTYMGMDSLLRLRYSMMAEDNNAILSPVGALWRYLRQNHPLIELYQTDESHPSVAGTYAAACAFYTVMFRKDPGLISYNPSLPAADAENIRLAAKAVVFDSLMQWNVGAYDPIAGFGYSIIGNEVNFTDSSRNAQSYFWDFGDGNTSTLQNPTHLYSNSGTYFASLVIENCGQSDTLSAEINVLPASNLNEQNAVSDFYLQLNPGDSELIMIVNPESIGKNYILYNSLGIFVSTETIYLERTILDSRNLSSGIYYLKIGDKTKSFIKK